MTRSTTTPTNKTWLSTKVRVEKYLALKQAENRAAIAKFLEERFLERYVIPAIHVTEIELVQDEAFGETQMPDKPELMIQAHQLEH